MTDVDLRQWCADWALGVATDDPGGMLAALALELHAPSGADLPEGSGPELLGLAREALLAPDDRRRAGAHYTPIALARHLAAIALEGADASAVVADPACGGGAFLLACAELLAGRGADPAAVVAGQLRGADLDPLAVATTQATLEVWAARRGVDVSASGIVLANGLSDWRPPASVDAVVGNPPFLSPLGTATARGNDDEASVRARFGSAVGAYSDTAALFLLAAVELVRPGGRVVLVQPESLLAARDATAIRTSLLDRAALEGLWVAGEKVFGAGVRVCAPVLRVGTTQPRRVRRWTGVDVRRASAVDAATALTATWAPLRPGSPSAVRTAKPAGTLADLATATAGFRDEFYGLAAAADEARSGDRRPRLVTSGLIDPGACAWGHRSARIGGRRFEAPVVEPAGLDDRLAAWVRARLVPKVLVATQTRVIEVVADAAGTLVPLTPVIAVTPHDRGDVWRIAAALTAPSVTAWALREFGGTALHSDAVKLSARQVLTVPYPADRGAWDAAADALAAGDVAACGALMTRAHRSSATVEAWWRARLPASRAVPV